MNPYKKFAKDVGLMSITQIILGLQAFLLLPILTKFLGATNFGIWSQIKITVSLLSGFSDAYLRKYFILLSKYLHPVPISHFGMLSSLF